MDRSSPSVPARPSSGIVLRAVIVLALIVAFSAIAVSAAWADTTFEGTVTAAGGGPLGGIEVQTFSWDATGSVWVDGPFTTTAGDGTYSLVASDTPEAITYGWRLAFIDATSNYYTQYYNGKALIDFADSIVAGVVHTGINGALQPRPSIYGRVYSANSLAPLMDATVTAYADLGSGFEPVATANADGTGFYALYGLTDGETYRVGAAADSYDSLFWDGAATLGAADDIVVTQGFPVGDVDLALGGGPTQPPTVDRIGGRDRYAVASAVAADAHPGWVGASEIVLASGDDRAAADPLAAAGLCWGYDGAPLLLMSSVGAVPPSTVRAVADAVSANTNVVVHVVGGTATLSSARLSQLRSAVAARLGLSESQAAARIVFRRVLATGTRFDLAAKIATEMKRLRPGDFPGRATIANGADRTKFFDALSASALAASTGAPVLLVGRDTVPPTTAGALSQLGIATTDRYAVGGPATISAKTLTSVGVAESRRFGGSDRYAVATGVANAGIDRGWFTSNARTVGLSATLPDALTGGAAVGTARGPMLLTSKSKLPTNTRNHLVSEKSRIARAIVFGGSRSVATSVENEVRDILK